MKTYWTDQPNDLVEAFKVYLLVAGDWFASQPDIIDVEVIRPEPEKFEELRLRLSAIMVRVAHYCDGQLRFDDGFITSKMYGDDEATAKHRLAAFNAFVDALEEANNEQ